MTQVVHTGAWETLRVSLVAGAEVCALLSSTQPSPALGDAGRGVELH